MGWIDGVRRSVDETSFVQRFTPRRKGSTWSAINVAKVAALTDAGRMRPAGLGGVRGATGREHSDLLVRARGSRLQPEEEARFRANAAAWADWESRPPSYRRAVTHWVTSAKQAATRARRLDTLIADSAARTQGRAHALVAGWLSRPADPLDPGTRPGVQGPERVAVTFVDYVAVPVGSNRNDPPHPPGVL